MMKAQRKFQGLREALRAADYGMLYIYVSPSLREGWLAEQQLPELKWYEKIVHVDRQESHGFLEDVAIDEPYALVAVAHGMVAFTAQCMDELLENMDLVRPWVEALIESYVRDGAIDPKTYSIP